MVKVISFKICPFFQQVVAVLHARNTPHEVEYADFDNCLFEISPTGKAPILITNGGDVLFDSVAIIAYLDELYPVNDADLSPEERAIAFGWGNVAVNNYFNQCNAMRSETVEIFNERVGLLNKALTKVEAAHKGTKFFTSEIPLSVDISWITLMYRAKLVERHTGFDFFQSFPKIKAWQSAVLKLETVEISVSEDFEDIFTNFYLNQNTYLGSKRLLAA